MSFPVLNLRTPRQRELARRARMRVQERLERRLASALRGAFTLERRLMVASFAAGQDNVEGRLNNVLQRTAPRFKAVLRDGIQRALDVFGRAVLGAAKSQGVAPERKDEEDVYESAIREFAEREAGKKVTRLQATTKKRVRKRIEDALIEAQETGERSSLLIADAIKDAYDGFTDARAYVIGRTETHNAALYAMQKAAEATRIPSMKKQWVSAPRDGRNRQFHLEMNGEEVGLHEKFLVENPDGTPDEMVGPGDTSAPPEQVVNCRCVLTFST